MTVRAEELTQEARSNIIGGSDAGTIAGLNPFKKPVELYLEKKMIVESKNIGLPGEVGNALEPVILAKYQEVSGISVIADDAIHVHPEYEWCVAHLDGISKGIAEQRGIECKSVISPATMPLWSKNEDDGIPDYVLAQVQHYMAVTGLKVFDVAVLLGNSDFRIYTIVRNDDFIEQLMKRELDFWNKLQDPHAEFENDNSEAWEKYLKLRFPQDSGQIIEVAQTESIYSDISELWQIKKREKEVKAELQKVKNVIMAFMGDAKKVTVEGGGSISFSTAKDSVKTEYAAMVERMKPLIPDEQFNKIEQGCTSFRKGSRSFRSYPPKEVK